jgi:hypothetical protein
MIRRGDPNMILSLSPVDGHSYFVAIGDVAEWIHDSQSLRKALEIANEAHGELEKLETVHTAFSLPSSRRSSLVRSSRGSIR